MTSVSVIIPALNESSQLPLLLAAINAQTRQPDEVIIADAGSTDGTVEIAHANNAIVVAGGMPANGRNAGASVASSQIFLFLDSDVIPEPKFIDLALTEFEKGGFAVATCPIKATQDDFTDALIMDATNLYIQLITPFSPRAPGFCIFAQRKIHEQIGGFDETLKMSEDHDYVRRASKLGSFGLLKSVKIPVSMRRLDKEGIVKLALKYLWCEMHALAGKPIYSMPFEYEFGAFHPSIGNKQKKFIDIGKLRDQLGNITNPVDVFGSLDLDRLKQLADFESFNSISPLLRDVFNRRELDFIESYVQKRLILLRRKGRVVFHWRKIKNISGEILQIFDKKWLTATNTGDKSEKTIISNQINDKDSSQPT